MNPSSPSKRRPVPDGDITETHIAHTDQLDNAPVARATLRHTFTVNQLSTALTNRNLTGKDEDQLPAAVDCAQQSLEGIIITVSNDPTRTRRISHLLDYGIWYTSFQYTSGTEVYLTAYGSSSSLKLEPVPDFLDRPDLALALYRPCKIRGHTNPRIAEPSDRRFPKGPIKDGDCIYLDGGAVGIAGAILRLNDHNLVVLTAGHVAHSRYRLYMASPASDEQIPLKRVPLAASTQISDDNLVAWYRQECGFLEVGHAYRDLFAEPDT